MAPCCSLTETAGMRRKRPCRICRRWFLPHPRAGKRQRVCDQPECQRERHRRACVAWHEENPNYDREDRLRRRLAADGGAPAAAQSDPMTGVDWEAARDVVGLEAAVLIEESGKVLVNWARDAVVGQARGMKGESGRLPR